MSALVFLAAPQQRGDGGNVFVALLGLVFAVLLIVALWRMFSKAGKPGWASLIPIYSTLVLLSIVGRPWWWLLLMFVPFVNFVVLIIVLNDLSKSFGHGVGFTLGLIFLSPIFLLILGLGGSRYRGPSAAPDWQPAIA